MTPLQLDSPRTIVVPKQQNALDIMLQSFIGGFVGSAANRLADKSMSALFGPTQAEVLALKEFEGKQKLLDAQLADINNDNQFREKEFNALLDRQQVDTGFREREMRLAESARADVRSAEEYRRAQDAYERMLATTDPRKMMEADLMRAQLGNIKNPPEQKMSESERLSLTKEHKMALDSALESQELPADIKRFVRNTYIKQMQADREFALGGFDPNVYEELLQRASSEALNRQPGAGSNAPIPRRDLSQQEWYRTMTRELPKSALASLPAAGALMGGYGMLQSLPGMTRQAKQAAQHLAPMSALRRQQELENIPSVVPAEEVIPSVVPTNESFLPSVVPVDQVYDATTQPTLDAAFKNFVGPFPPENIGPVMSPSPRVDPLTEMFYNLSNPAARRVFTNY